MAGTGKHVPSEGHALLSGNVSLSSSTLSANLFVNGNASAWTDVYVVTISSSDTTVQTVTISDGTASVVYQIGASPIVDAAVVPYRFKKGATLTATAGAVTSAKTINVSVRGVTPWT